MSQSVMELDVWVRNSDEATTHQLRTVPAKASAWSEDDVQNLLVEMLLALGRATNPGGEPPSVTLRGFSWIVSPVAEGGVLLHLEMQSGTASAGPFAIGDKELTDLITRVMTIGDTSAVVH